MRTGLLALSVLGIACGRFGFDGRGNADDDGGDPDAVSSDDAPSGDGALDGAPYAGPNRVFITNVSTTGSFGGIAGADALCRAAALGAGLPDTFVAWISTTAIDARDRLAGSRGWVRVDGAPVADTIDDWLAGRRFNAIVLDEHGTKIGGRVWTGTGADGRYDTGGGACADWTGGTNGRGEDSEFLPAFSLSPSCTTTMRLFCFETSNDVVVGPRTEAGRIAFLGFSTATTGRAGLDAACQTEAASAGLPGTFLAALATTTATIRSRFTIDATPWRRVDGTRLTADAGGLFDGTDLESFLHQRADGSYLNVSAIRTGASSPSATGTASSTCSDWTTTTGNPSIGYTDSTRSARLWSVGSTTCASVSGLICLQQ